MPDFDPEAFGGRLKAEVEAKGWDVKALQKAVRKELDKTGRTAGSSYGTIWKYVRGQAPVEPRREVVEVLADLLGVRADYLLFGSSKTEEEARRESSSVFVVHAVMERRRLQLSGVEGPELEIKGLETELDALGSIMMAMNDLPDVPMAGKDVIAGFLNVLPLHLRRDDAAEVVDGALPTAWEGEQEIRAAIRRYFPVEGLGGNYGEKMACVLAHAQLAYLHAFGSDAPTHGAEPEAPPAPREQRPPRKKGTSKDDEDARRRRRNAKDRPEAVKRAELATEGKRRRQRW